MKLDLRNNAAAQDMIRIIMREKNLSAEDAVAFAVNRDMYQKILKAGYASIAFDLWGHDNPERVWDALSTPVCKCQRKSEPGAHEKVSHKRPRKSEPERSRIVEPVC